MVNKTIIFLGDGMADESIAELGNKTPLQYAKTPAMDTIARTGVSGSLLTLPDQFPTSSEVANMSVLGCDLATEYRGRGPLEAAGQGLELLPGDNAFRLNLTSVKDGILTDFSGGHVDQDSAEQIIDVLNKKYANDYINFYPGVSYRNLLILSGSDYSSDIKAEKPDDNQGERVEDHMPTATNPGARKTLEFLTRIIREAPSMLEECSCNQIKMHNNMPMANGVWPWSGGVAGSFKTLREKYGISGAVISAVDVIRGLGKCLGMDVINVEGATGYIDTNYEGKADAAIEAIKTHDLVYLHLESIDEVSHEQNLKYKIQAIEDFDSKIVGKVLSATGNNINMVVLPDHPVPVAHGKHTRTPVPVAARIAGRTPDSVVHFDEFSCLNGSLGPMVNGDLMNILFR